VGLAHLPEDLRLAQDHRVEPRGHAEEVPHGHVAASRQHRRAERRVVHVVEARQEARECRDAVLVLGEAVDLRAVARGDDRPLREIRSLKSPSSAWSARSGVEGESLAKVERAWRWFQPTRPGHVKTCSRLARRFTAV